MDHEREGERESYCNLLIEHIWHKYIAYPHMHKYKYAHT